MQNNLNNERKRHPLFEFAYIGKTEQTLNALKNMGMPELWEYTRTANERPLPILYSYLIHTFTRVQEQGKIAFSDDYSCFNTGLVTPNQQEIFMVFRKYHDGSGWGFWSFSKESHHTLGRFQILPERAAYFADPADLMFDTRLPLRVNIDHIIDDEENFSRFPSELKLWPTHQLINTFNGAISHAITRSKRNYKTAVPQYYRNEFFPNGQLQLLLPLCLRSHTEADLALAISKKDGFYSGKTCLTLDMAINNARLIARPDEEWLKA